MDPSHFMADDGLLPRAHFRLCPHVRNVRAGRLKVLNYSTTCPALSLPPAQGSPRDRSRRPAGPTLQCPERPGRPAAAAPPRSADGRWGTAGGTGTPAADPAGSAALPAARYGCAAGRGPPPAPPTAGSPYTDGAAGGTAPRAAPARRSAPGTSPPPGPPAARPPPCR